VGAAIFGRHLSFRGHSNATYHSPCVVIALVACCRLSREDGTTTPIPGYFPLLLGEKTARFSLKSGRWNMSFSTSSLCRRGCIERHWSRPRQLLGHTALYGFERVRSQVLLTSLPTRFRANRDKRGGTKSGEGRICGIGQSPIQRWRGR